MATQAETEKGRETHAHADNIDYGDDNEQTEREGRTGCFKLWHGR